MSTSRAVKPPRRDDTLLTGWQPVAEQAPSIVREDQATVPRVLAMIGLFLILLGLIPYIAPLIKIERPIIEATTGFMSITVGLLLVVFHAFADRERAIRRLYSSLGLFGIALAVIIRVWPAPGVRERFPIIGLPALGLSLVLLIASARSETEKGWRTLLINILGAVGALMILTAVGVGVFTPGSFVIQHLPGELGIYLVLGLLYLGAFIAMVESAEISYYAGLALGAVGLLAFAGGLTRSLLPESIFLVPNGLILMGAGVVYLGVAAGVCLDWPIVVLSRRELTSYFYSPVAYLVLVGMILLGWFCFWQFVGRLAESSTPMSRFRPMFEPIVAQYFFALIPVIVQIFIVPAITMRLLAEEKRTGTLEVLLTAPVNEATVVISKFLGAWLFYLLTWAPMWLALMALRSPYLGDTEFDYRPLLSFNLAMISVGAGFIAMGLFFSALTNNQIIAAVLTFVGMIAHLAAYLVKWTTDLTPGTTWYEVLTYVSYLDLWLNALEGVFAPRYLIFHVSVTVFFLYLTIQVLESRKWR
jgi:ABC-type transport system involved in multi-copper enzyme maturation permease subunit